MVKLNHRWVLFFVILLIFLTGSIGFVYFLWQRSLPNYRGTHSLTGLTDTVEVKWDEHGIPWIETSHLADAYKVQGYITARDRFFQMELTRRKISGTLAE
ncbi:MAG: penicillin acylase family protein, partial [Proteobacteria bacterium]|nr:penicillin acylase family protein [Pseudomonadota bacterium]